MTRIPDMIPITDLRQDSSAVLRKVKASREPLIITQRGRAAAVLLSVAQYERSENERRMLRLLARGEREIREGSGFDLQSILAEADALLAEE